jgi:hypothetical protein
MPHTHSADTNQTPNRTADQLSIRSRNWSFPPRRVTHAAERVAWRFSSCRARIHCKNEKERNFYGRNNSVQRGRHPEIRNSEVHENQIRDRQKQIGHPPPRNKKPIESNFYRERQRGEFKTCTPNTDGPDLTRAANETRPASSQLEHRMNHGGDSPLHQRYEQKN